MRKLILLGLVIVVGLVVLKKTEAGRLVRVWWHGNQAELAAAIPVETRIEQLKLTIADTEKQVRALTNKQSKLEVAHDLVKEEVEAVKTAQGKRAAEMKTLIAALDGEGEKVAFDGKTVEAADLQKRLDRATRDYTSGKALLKAKEELLAARRQIVDASEEQRVQVRQKVEDLRVVVAKLEARLASVRAEQAEGTTPLDADLAESQRLVTLIETTLRENEKLQEIKARDGQVSVKPEVVSPSRAASVKAAQQALRAGE
jgi:chromosome segregation ATPase